jgi:hypothetical protein
VRRKPRERYKECERRGAQAAEQALAHN